MPGMILFVLISAYTHMYMMCICGMYLCVYTYACATVHLWSSGDSMLRWLLPTCVRQGLVLSHMAGSLAPKVPGILLSPLILFRDHGLYSSAWVPGATLRSSPLVQQSAVPTEPSP